MLSESLKQQIQSVYRQQLEARELTPRYGQRQMIAEIANSLASLNADASADSSTDASASKGPDEPRHSPVCVVEAGTGTGKTLAYLLGTIPVAKEKKLKVVIATATVALQEQVMGKDIPELLRGADLEFSFALAKGRGRYLCLARLDNLLRGNDSAQAMADLYGEDLDASGSGYGSDTNGKNSKLYTDMLNAISAGDWQGDRDDWKIPLSEQEWRPVTVDNAGCSGARCSHFRNCCFYRARDNLARADCIVTNHDLVLSDLALGGGVILPEPEDTIYVFDEAHHLPLKSNNHFASFTQLRATASWLERCEGIAERLHKDDFIDGKERQSLTGLVRQLRTEQSQMRALLEQVLDSSDSLEQYDSRSQHTFAAGQVPDAVQAAAENLANGFSRFSAELERALERVRDELEDHDDSKRVELAEQWSPLLGSTSKRATANLALWRNYAAADPEGRAPNARWLSLSEQDHEQELLVAASPVLAADNLQENLWQRCAAAVLTSATLSALGNFDMLRMRAGLPEHTRYLSIPSPFDFANAARLMVPRLNCLPTDNPGHTQALIRAIPKLLPEQCAALMLFASRRQMLEVLDGLPGEWQERILCQDDYQKAQLLKYHKQRVDAGEGSLIFGLASFAEGVDLPGHYCTQVLIAKIPFAVPNDPIEMTLANWIEQQGRNAFMTLAVPDAAFRLVQASGRLLRSESDSGQIILFDERIVSKRYGKQILESLPPYSRDIFTWELSA
ncbi:MAG: ATP-dependent DNA helicase DinG [Pseudohongiellaceae bacterium]